MSIKTTGLARGVLAKIVHTQDDLALHDGNLVTPKILITTVEVRRHPQYASVTNFHVEFFMKDKVDAKWRVGTLDAHTIDRRTQGISKPVYMTELLEWDLERPMCHASSSDENAADELQTITRHIIHDTGRPRTAYHNRPLLNANLHFIAYFELDNEFKGKCLAQLAMKAYHEAIQNLPSEYAFKGTVILSPAAVRSVYLARKGHGKPAKSYLEVEHILIDKYRESGYKVWSKGDDSLEGSAITIMGRTIGEVRSGEDDWADEVDFPPLVESDDCHAPATDGRDTKSTEKQESVAEKRRGSGSVKREDSGAGDQKSSRKRKAAEESGEPLQDVSNRPTKRRLCSVAEKRLVREFGHKDRSSRCDLCGMIGGGLWHTNDCKARTPSLVK